MLPTRDELAPMVEHYEAGRFLRAFEASRSIGPLESWRGTSGRLWSGRLARHCGSSALGTRQILRAWRHDPGDWEARYFFLWTLMDYRGAFAVWRRMEQWGAPPEDDAKLATNFMILRGRTAAFLRDFETADRWFALADKTAGDAPWLAVERSRRLACEDRTEEALETVQTALAASPDNWALIHETGRCLQSLGRDEEALTLLRRGAATLESAFLCQSLHALETELDLHREALATLERLERFSPIADTGLKEWIAAMRSTGHYQLGETADAIRWGRQAGDNECWKTFVARLENPDPDHRRKVLPVGFVQQGDKTCVPATLTILGRHWQRAVDHLGVAEEICYDGTPSHSERRWAERNGWCVREFKVTLAATRSLIDRGIPFALTTVAPMNGHEQAVMGYDDFRGSLLIRDPGSRNRRELLVGPLFEGQKSSGPRGMVMVPREEAALLDGLELPEADLYDLHHRLLDALDRHERPAAREALDALASLAPEHRLFIQAQRALAAYDRDAPKLLAALERLLELFPDDVNFQLGRLSCLRDLALREDRMRILKELGRSREADPLLCLELASELAQDAREHAEARRLLDRVDRARPHDASAFLVRAGIEWAAGRLESAVELYRFATCLDDKREDLAFAHFRACRQSKRTEEALGFLRRRFELHGNRSSLPGRSLVWAYTELDRSAEALEVLKAAQGKRPEDGDLKLFAAERLFDHGQFLRSEALLNEAKSLTGERTWLRAAASLAERKGATAEALKHWKTILEQEPMALDAYQAAAHLLHLLEGRTAAIGLLDAAGQRFPHFVPLHRLRAEWARIEGPEASVAVASQLVGANPADAWARRELALALSLLGRQAEARVQAEAAIVIEPGSSTSHSVLGTVLAASGDAAGAGAAFREALRKSADDLQAMRGLLESAGSLEERKQAAAFIRDELARQTTFGDGLLQFPDTARPYLEPEELLRIMADANRERPDLWQSWSGHCAQLLAMNEAERALRVATGATERFPLVPRLWMDLAQVHRARLDREAEIAAMEHARELNPGWGWAMRELASAHESQGRLAKAREILEAVRRRAPLDPFTLGMLGQVLWRQGDREGAFELVRQAVLIEPGYDWGWARLSEWGPAVGRSGTGIELAEELARRRPGEARSWLMLARLLDAPSDLEKALATLDRATELNPRLVEAWSLRAFLLARAGRWNEALEACRPAAFGDRPPADLRGREAWIFAQRGDTEAAIMRMRGALSDDPSLIWGWRCLADWQMALERHNDALESVDMLCRLAPGDAVTLGYSADLKLKLDRRAEAKGLLRQAFELAPGYQWAGDTLFHLQLEAREFSDALDTLGRLRSVLRAPSVCERELWLMLALGNRGEASKTLAALCATTDDEPEVFQRVAEKIVKAGLIKEGLAVASKALAQDGGNPEAAAFWVDLRGRDGQFRNWSVLERLAPRGERAARGFLRQLEVTVDDLLDLRHRQQIFGETFWDRRFRKVLKKHAEWFRSDTRLWGKMGYVLKVRGRAARVAEWMRDWRDRPDAEPWMFVNLLAALHQLGRDDEAREVIRHVRRLPRRDGASVRFELFEAIDSAVDGNEAPGRELAATLKNASLSEYDGILRRFLELAAGGSLVATGMKGIDPVHKQTLQTFLINHARNKTMLRAYRVLTRRLAERSGKPWFGHWCRWKAWITPLVRQ